MAQRRMFSPEIVGSEEFLDMPSSSRELYFQLGMYADDDGFIQPKKVMRMIGAQTDDLKILLTKRFLLSFENGVVVIKHWLIHNLIRADLYKETLYKKEKKTLGLNENGAYTELREGVNTLKQIEPPEWLKRRRGELRTANVPQTVHRLGKVRLGKDRDSDSDFPFLLNVEFIEAFTSFIEMRTKKKRPTTERARRIILSKLHKHPIDIAILMLDKSTLNGWQGVFELKPDEIPAPPPRQKDPEPEPPTPEERARGLLVLQQARDLALSKKMPV